MEKDFVSRYPVFFLVKAYRLLIQISIVHIYIYIYIYIFFFFNAVQHVTCASLEFLEHYDSMTPKSIFNLFNTVTKLEKEKKKLVTGSNGRTPGCAKNRFEKKKKKTDIFLKVC